MFDGKRRDRTTFTSNYEEVFIMLNEINILIARALDESNPDQNIQSIIDYGSNDDSEYKRFVNLLNTDFSSAFDKALKGDVILRGTSFKGQIVLGSPGNRVSQNTTNIYTRLISDVLPSWKNYPKRNHSFICTESYTKSTAYQSTRYLMLPENGSKIGICSSRDLWDSFGALYKFGIPDLSAFNSSMSSLMVLPVAIDMDYWDKHQKEYPALSMLYGTEINKISIDTYFKRKSVQEILQLFIDFENLCRNNSKVNYEKHETSVKFREIILKRILDHNEHLIDILNEVLSPKANDFKLVSIENYSSESKGHEVWTDGECLMINMDIPIYYAYHIRDHHGQEDEIVSNFIKRLFNNEPRLKDLFDILTKKIIDEKQSTRFDL